MKGIPQILSGLTTAGADDALAVLYSRADACFVGDLFHRALLQFEAAITGLFLPVSKRLVVTTDATTAAKLVAAWTEESGSKLVVSPRTGQTGKVLFWETLSNNIPGDLSTVLTNDYQKRTAWGLISTATYRCLNATPAFEPMVLLDQPNGDIGFCNPNGEAETEMETFTADGDTLAFQFEEEKGRLVFE